MFAGKQEVSFYHFSSEGNSNATVSIIASTVSGGIVARIAAITDATTNDNAIVANSISGANITVCIVAATTVATAVFIVAVTVATTVPRNSEIIITSI